jgi:hypothetical protein
VGLALSLGFITTLLVILETGTAWAVDLLVSGPFDSFESYNGEEWRGYPESQGLGWTVNVLEEDGLHFMDSETFGHFAADLYGVPDNNYRIEGSYSQVFASRHGFDFVFSQTVAVDVGHDYAFGGKVVTFWKGPGGEWDDSKIFKRIGVDPSGGLSYDGPNVIWTDWDGTDNAWTSPALAFRAQASQTTVFIQVENVAEDVGAAYLNTGYFDNFKFELAPVATLALPSQAAPGPVNISWGVTIPDPGFWNLWGYDVEYKEDAVGIWQTIQTHDGSNGQDTSFNFTAEAGQTYTFRVRPWQQRAPAGDPATTAMPGVWVEKSVTVGQAIVGQVIDHAGLGLNGVTVSVNGTTTSTLSTDGGSYQLSTGAAGTFDIKADDYNGLVAPPPTAVTTTQDSPGNLTIMLRPTGAHQALNNNDFEVNLSNWTVSGSATVSDIERHTGNRSLLLTGGAAISQIGSVTDMRFPLLSFWYKTDNGATLAVDFLGASGSLQTKTLDAASDWTHVTIDSGLGERYTGLAGVEFSHAGGTSIFIDEVSLAAGPYKTYLPLILKN